MHGTHAFAGQSNTQWPVGAGGWLQPNCYLLTSTASIRVSIHATNSRACAHMRIQYGGGRWVQPNLFSAHRSSLHPSLHAAKLWCALSSRAIAPMRIQYRVAC